ncbi:AraC family transcriptional regulator [Rhizobium sp. ZPR3]|uniref:AraC family transcriptional regulator n=2 Tax=unclassified Rhizobium TaxID=2613769 RepID=A0AAU7SI41_9HYPH
MLADRVSLAIRKGYKIPLPPTVVARIAGASEIAFSHFKNLEPRLGLSVPSPREEAFVFNIPLAPARYPIVSIDGRRQSVIQDPGKAYLFDLTSRNEVSLDTSYDSIRIHLPQTTIDSMAYERGLPRVGGLRASCLGQDDVILYRLALTVLPAILNSVPVTTAFMEYIALALHDHVIYTYGNIQRGASSTGGLTPWQARRACDYIEANLADDLSIAELGRECGISASYFARAFRVTFGMTPHQWITRRRIELAKSLMAQATESLAGIAITCGFVDQSHLGRHFLRLEGISPAQWRRRRHIGQGATE